MKIFISWSGAQSKAMAEALKEWVPLVIPSAELFFSRDIESGARWSAEIAARLESSNFGIICVTSANQQSSWLNFEAGALSKMFDTASVIPLALDLDVSEIKQPLGQFQAQPATRDGVAAMVAAINARCDVSRRESELEALLEALWPQLESRFSAARALKTSTTKRRPEREILDEVLTTVRGLAYRLEQAASTELHEPAPSIRFPGNAPSLQDLEVVAAQILATIGRNSLVPRVHPHQVTIELACANPLTERQDEVIRTLASGVDLTIVAIEPTGGASYRRRSIVTRSTPAASVVNNIRQAAWPTGETNLDAEADEAV